MPTTLTVERGSNNAYDEDGNIIYKLSGPPESYGSWQDVIDDIKAGTGAEYMITGDDAGGDEVTLLRIDDVS